MKTLLRCAIMRGMTQASLVNRLKKGLPAELADSIETTARLATEQGHKLYLVGGGVRDLLLAYLEELDFRIARCADGKPSVRIQPKTFRGRPYSSILGISSKHLSTALNQVIDEAVAGVLDGYGKGSVLTGIFARYNGSSRRSAGRVRTISARKHRPLICQTIQVRRSDFIVNAAQSFPMLLIAGDQQNIRSFVFHIIIL